jgi:DNA repair protein RecO (recombination protein O)
MATYSDEGVVLRTIKLGEADRIVTLATPEHGKVRVVAKGVRKPKSRLAGRLEPLTYLKVMCWRGRELDVVNQVEAIEHFKAIRGDLDRVPIALTMLEVVDHVALERQPMAELFRMLIGALRALEQRSSPALLGAFLWKLLALEGVGPSLEQCASCGEEVELVAFDAGEGGFLCRSCRRGQAVSADTVSLVRQVLNGGLRGALELEPSRATAEAQRLAMLATEYHLDRRVRSAHRGAEIPTAGLAESASTKNRREQGGSPSGQDPAASVCETESASPPGDPSDIGLPPLAS